MSADPHFDPSAKSVSEKMSTIRCGDCLKPITAPSTVLHDAYNQHQLVCSSVRR